MMKAIVASLLLVVSTSAFAAEGGGEAGSEFFFQTHAGGQDLTPKITYFSESDKLKGAANTTDTTGFLVGAEYEYGVMEGLAVGAALSYESASVDDSTDYDIKGLQNVELFVKGSSAAGPGAFKYGANLSLSPGDLEIDSNSDRNAYTGGHDLVPYVGYEYGMGAESVFGAKLAFTLELGDKTVTTDPGSVESKVSGGERTTISLFYEHQLAALKLGVALDWATVADVDSKTAGVTTTTEQVSPQQTLRVYTPMVVGTGTLLPELRYGFTTDDKRSSTDIDTYDRFALAVGYRIAL